MSDAFSQKYSDAERAAVVAAYERPGVSGPRVVELARTGQLRSADGTALPAFDIPANTVRSMAREARPGRASTSVDAVDQVDDDDALDPAKLRRDLLQMARRGIARLRKLERQGHSVDGDELRQLARAIREAQAIQVTQLPASAPAAQATTAGSLGRAIVDDHRSAPPPAELLEQPQAQPAREPMTGEPGDVEMVPGQLDLVREIHAVARRNGIELSAPGDAVRDSSPVGRQGQPDPAEGTREGVIAAARRRGDSTFIDPAARPLPAKKSEPRRVKGIPDYSAHWYHAPDPR